MFTSAYSNGTAIAEASSSMPPMPYRPPSSRGNPSWTPDPAIGHLLNSMRKVGPKADPVGGGFGASELDPEEEFEFLEQLLQSRELNALVKAHNVILFCNQVNKSSLFRRIV